MRLITVLLTSSRAISIYSKERYDTSEYFGLLSDEKAMKKNMFLRVSYKDSRIRTSLYW